MLRSHEQIVTATGGDPYARWGIDPAVPVLGVERDGAVAWVVAREQYEDRPWVNAVGAPAAVADLVSEVLTDRRGTWRPTPVGITVPHGTLDLMPTDLRPPEHGDWSWWWIDQAPSPRPHEELVVDLVVRRAAGTGAAIGTGDGAGDGAAPGGAGRDHDELVALLREANPTASAWADDPAVRTWVGLREPSGRLVACAADRPYAAAVPHLASIAVHPDARGKGYGAAVTAAITRRAFREHGAPAVTLGMYADNAVGRALYERLGFHEEHRFTSGDLPRSLPR